MLSVSYTATGGHGRLSMEITVDMSQWVLSMLVNQIWAAVRLPIGYLLSGVTVPYAKWGMAFTDHVHIKNPWSPFVAESSDWIANV